MSPIDDQDKAYQAIPMSASLLDEEKAALLAPGADQHADELAGDASRARRPSAWKRFAKMFGRLILVLLIVRALMLAVHWPAMRRLCKGKGAMGDGASQSKSPSYHSIIPGHPPLGPPHGHAPPPPPPHHGPPPPFPPMHGPKAIECLDISSPKAAVNFSVTLKFPGAPIVLWRNLNEADISIVADETDEQSTEDVSYYHDHGHRGPSAPPPPPPPPHHFPPGRPRSQSILISAKRLVEDDNTKRTIITSADYEESKEMGDKDEKVFICSLELPFGHAGVGLFHEPPKEHDEKRPCHKRPTDAAPEKEQDEQRVGDAIDAHHEKPKEEAFPRIALEIHHNAGEPITVTTAGPPFAPHRPHVPHGPPGPPGPPPHHPHGFPPLESSQPREHRTLSAILIVVTKVSKKVGCAGRRLVQSIGKSAN